MNIYRSIVVAGLLLIGLPCAYGLVPAQMVPVADRPFTTLFGPPDSIVTAEWMETPVPSRDKEGSMMFAGVPSIYSYRGVRLFVLRKKEGGLIFVSVKSAESLTSETIEKLKEACGCSSSSADMKCSIVDGCRQFTAYSTRELARMQE